MAEGWLHDSSPRSRPVASHRRPRACRRQGLLNVARAVAGARRAVTDGRAEPSCRGRPTRLWSRRESAPRTTTPPTCRGRLPVLDTTRAPRGVGGRLGWTSLRPCCAHRTVVAHGDGGALPSGQRRSHRCGYPAAGDPDVSRRGVARALLQTARAAALARHRVSLLDVVESHRAAVALYRRSGWVNSAVPPSRSRTAANSTKSSSRRACDQPAVLDAPSARYRAQYSDTRRSALASSDRSRSAGRSTGVSSPMTRLGM
jgi:Acetyltransferase (GNAT) family